MEEIKLSQKLAKIRKMCEVITKDAKGYNYKYVSISEILAKVSAGMNKYGVSLTPIICHDSIGSDPVAYYKVKFTKDGVKYEEPTNEYVVKGNMIYRWSDDETGECIDVPFYLIGSQGDPSQAFGSALTYSLRYFLLTYFQIATLDEADPDAWRSKQKESEDLEKRTIAEAIVQQVDEIIKANFTDENKSAITDMVKKVVKINGKASANYLAVTDPEMAKNLLDETRKFFKIEG